jgi:type II secretory pathway pseudopilin PulG
MRMNGNTMKQPHGLTLMEVVIACAVLSIAIAGTFNCWINSQRIASVAREEAIAQMAINQAIAEMRSESFAQIPTFFTAGPYDPTNIAYERFTPWVVPVEVAGDSLPRGLQVSTTQFSNSIKIGDRWYGPKTSGSVESRGEMRIILVNDEDPVEQELGEVAGDMDGVDLNKDGQISNIPCSKLVNPSNSPIMPLDYSTFTDTGAQPLFPRRLRIGTAPMQHQYINVSELAIMPVIVQVRWWSDAGFPREITVITFLTNRAGATYVPPAN